MSWIRSSKSAALVALLALSLAAVGTAGAISVSPGEVPNETQVGETVTTTVTVDDPFVDMNDQWTLQGSTELTNVSWTVTVLQQGEEVDQASYGEQSFEQALNASNGGDTVEIALTGDTPAVENYTYEPRETYTLYDFASVQGSSTSDLNATSVHHYTNASDSARLAIDDASEAINASSGNSDAENLLNNAISAYENGNFGNAEDLAGQAQNQAEQAQQSAQRNQTILMGVGALVVLAIVVGGVYYWRSNQNEPTKLQ
ncbi:hypothetical protein I7X12_07090 [Halosimplex litoreum]|uniref:Uncharacterized protein n=1 Tax=Halosimplex litoreum TaxID=1198301 RepID=A0A7T3G0Z1_9EURY|nr:hypothetical protein [Halosimplex litoreum]QPV64371.1 hypothetical protein I7X12_07090 [Halosimplex litoreum]